MQTGWSSRSGSKTPRSAPACGEAGSPLDEYELTGHTEQWREDLARVEETGASALRYGFPWYRVNPAPGVFDWSWTDQVVAFLPERKV